MAGFLLPLAIGAMASGLFGGKDKTHQLPTMNPEQEQQLQALLQMLSPQGQLGQAQSQGLEQLTQLMDPSASAYQRFAQPYMNEFEQQTIPGLAERFAGMGANSGALSSSGFGQALSSAGAGLQSNLAGMKSELQQQAIRDIMQQYQGLTGQALGQKPFGYQHSQGGPGLMGSALAGYASKGFPGAGDFITQNLPKLAGLLGLG